MLKLYCHTPPEALTVPERNIHFHQINRLISLMATQLLELKQESVNSYQREREKHGEEREREKHKGEQALTAAIHSCISICQS